MTEETAQQGRWIRPLPERLVNKIAAGEVIERPASVLKELVENALDAGATRIEVNIEKSGVTRIEVHDNGCGISREQLEIAFSRHATSKITDFSDLELISSFGFRGEALPSIASVSRLRMITKPATEDHATEISIEGGVVSDVRPAHRADGSSVVVEDLFFNTPARKKFLRSENTEARQLSRTASSQALCALGVALTVTLNGRKLFSFSENDDLKTRAARILGAAPGALLEVKAEEGALKLHSILGRPDVARSIRGGLHLFINRRALRSSPLLSAFYLGYGELLPRGLFPIGVALLEVDGRAVDVNVHPAKSEVRLSDEQDVHRFVRRSVRESLRQEGVTPEFSLRGSPPNLHSDADTADPASRDFPIGGPSAVTGLAQQAPSATEQLFGGSPSGEELSAEDSSAPAPEHERPPLTPEALSDGTVYLGQFNNLYLLAQRANDLYLIDQHAAHERILFEQTMSDIQKRSAVSQRLLFPVNVELSAERMIIFEQRRSELAEIGFEMSHLGGQTVMLDAVPAILAHRSPEQVFGFSLDDIQRLTKSGYTPLKAVAQSIACRSAVMAGDRLDEQEAREIIRRLMTCDTGYSCPHGRPTFVRISRAELDRKFGRA
ncbi:MAG: DNA mismatch repair endonuclease MutL [Candidatus Zixiibacteriota bacterium]